MAKGHQSGESPWTGLNHMRRRNDSSKRHDCMAEIVPTIFCISHIRVGQMQEVRAHGWAKVESCRSNDREQRMEQLPRSLLRINKSITRKI